MLSSIRVPRLRPQPEPYAVEAKEFMRGRLIGKSVDVSMEYARTIPSSMPGQENLRMYFG